MNVNNQADQELEGGQVMLDLDAAKARIDQAHAHVCDIAMGRARWKMSIPAQVDTDSDLLLAVALGFAIQAIEEVRELRTQRDSLVSQRNAVIALVVDDADASDGMCYWARKIRELLTADRAPGPPPDASVDGPVVVSEPTAGSGGCPPGLEGVAGYVDAYGCRAHVDGVHYPNSAGKCACGLAYDCWISTDQPEEA